MWRDPALLITALLTLGVIFVNGWTDAPNAVATCVGTRCLSPKAAVRLSAIFNFLGVAYMTAVNGSVAMTIKNMVNFSDQRGASAALCAALLSIIVWAVIAWYFGIPTSESHALIAGISGAALALHNGIQGIQISEWLKVIYGLVLSTSIGFIGGFLAARWLVFIHQNDNRQYSARRFRKGQVIAAAAMSFMHGAQDGQKFIGILLLGVSLVKENSSLSFTSIPLWMILVCSTTMSLGTSFGGYKIIKSVGIDMVKMEPYQGFAADGIAAIALLCSSVLGLPVSTTHTKTTAVMGVGLAKRRSTVRLDVVREMFLAWILTFPLCGALGWLFSKLFVPLFIR